MEPQMTKTVINLVNGLECIMMRDTFLQIQEDENTTNEQLVKDATKWNNYLDAYCLLFQEMNRNIPVQ